MTEIITRREAISRVGGGFGGLVLASMLDEADGSGRTRASGVAQNVILKFPPAGVTLKSKSAPSSLRS